MPYVCKRCSEMLSEDQAHCPFCGDAAIPLDEMADRFNGHTLNCDYWHDHYPHECTCAGKAAA